MYVDAHDDVVPRESEAKLCLILFNSVLFICFFQF